jgi:hypothetical protein
MQLSLIERLFAAWQDRGVERFIILIASDYLASADFKMPCLRVEANVMFLVMLNSGKHLQQSSKA